MWKIITKYNTQSYTFCRIHVRAHRTLLNIQIRLHKNRLWNFLLIFFPAFSFSHSLVLCVHLFAFISIQCVFFSMLCVRVCGGFLISAIFGSMQHFIINYNTLSRLVKLKLSVNFIYHSSLGTFYFLLFIGSFVRSFVCYVRHILCCRMLYETSQHGPESAYV